jgi:hypothetical protein
MKPVLLLALALLAAPLFAQRGGVSDDYIRERERQKFAKPHGFSAQVDLFGLFPYFDQWQRVKADGLKADKVDFRDDAGGLPFGAFFDCDVRLRFTWHDSIEMGYSFAFLRRYDEFESTTRWNGFTYPKGVDIDYETDFHDMHVMYRRDLFRLGLSNNFSFFIQAGLEWAVIDARVGSDDMPPLNNRKRERFRELLPWTIAGVGIVWDITDHMSLRADAYGGFQADFPTFQKREGKRVDQSVLSIAARAMFEWRPVSFFAVNAGVRYRLLSVELESGRRLSEFLWFAIGPEVGFGLRF